MKGITKAFQRAPHMLTSRVGMSKKSEADAMTAGLVTRFATLEGAINTFVKDAVAYRDSVNNLLSSSTNFAAAFTTLFSPMGSESLYEFESKFPQAKQTIQFVSTYEAVFMELRETIRPEVELIDSRILAPAKELQEYTKKARKAITKREHKLVDYDRHSNTYHKLREKQNKTLNDEKNMFKVEQDYEQASSEYEHYNRLLQDELPRYFAAAQAFITPLYSSFYYMQCALNVYYSMLEKLQGFASETGMNVQDAGDIEAIFYEKQGDAAQRLNDLSVTKRGMSTAQLLSIQRNNSVGSGAGGSSYGRSKAASLSSPPGSARFTPPINRTSSHGSAHSGGAAFSPPPYSAGGSGAAAQSAAPGAKRAPPPPPALKPRPSTGPPAAVYCTALYDYTAQSAGDISFRTGDRIEVVKKGENGDEWWTGRVNGATGLFPSNYVQM